MNEPTNTSPARAAIYVRSATEQFNPGHLEDQERRCRAAIAEQVPGVNGHQKTSKFDHWPTVFADKL